MGKIDGGGVLSLRKSSIYGMWIMLNKFFPPLLNFFFLLGAIYGLKRRICGRGFFVFVFFFFFNSI